MMVKQSCGKVVSDCAHKCRKPLVIISKYSGSDGQIARHI